MQTLYCCLILPTNPPQEGNLMLHSSNVLLQLFPFCRFHMVMKIFSYTMYNPPPAPLWYCNIHQIQYMKCLVFP